MSAEKSYLVAVGSNIAHIAKHGRKSVYALGKTPFKPDEPELGEVFCGVKPDWWGTATLDLIGFGSAKHPDNEECQRCSAAFESNREVL